MRATPLTRLAYSCQGGSFETLTGRLSPQAAEAELLGLMELGASCLAVGDRDAAAFCADLMDQLGDAAAGVLRWARAA